MVPRVNLVAVIFAGPRAGVPCMEGAALGPSFRRWVTIQPTAWTGRLLPARSLLRSLLVAPLFLAPGRQRPSTAGGVVALAASTAQISARFGADLGFLLLPFLLLLPSGWLVLAFVVLSCFLSLARSSRSAGSSRRAGRRLPSLVSRASPFPRHGDFGASLAAGCSQERCLCSPGVYGLFVLWVLLAGFLRRLVTSFSIPGWSVLRILLPFFLRRVVVSFSVSGWVSYFLLWRIFVYLSVVSWLLVYVCYPCYFFCVRSPFSTSVP